MTGFQIATTLFAMLCGNLAAVVAPAVNLGLFWNAVIGGICGAGALALAPRLGWDWVLVWHNGLLLAGLAGFLGLLLAGGLVALRYRD